MVEERLEQAMQKSLEEQGWSDGEGEQPEDGSLTPCPGGSVLPGAGAGADPGEQTLSEFLRRFAQRRQPGLLEVTTSAAQAVAGYLAREVARMALFLICFALVLVGWTMLSRVLDLAFRLPVLSTLNHWSGAAVGLGKGCVLLFIACWLFLGLFPRGGGGAVCPAPVLLRSRPAGPSRRVFKRFITSS